jgi:hypothetical protein
MSCELIISSDTDASSGTYETRRAAMDALDAAAKADGLSVRCGALTKIGLPSRPWNIDIVMRFDIGALVDADDIVRFRFQIREPRERSSQSQ